jgi:hypothetical protein
LIQSYAFDREFHTFLQGLVATAVKSVDDQQQQLQQQPAAAAPAPALVNSVSVYDSTNDVADLPWQQLTHVNVATATGTGSMSDEQHADIDTSSDTNTATASATTAGNKRKVLSPDASSNVSEVRFVDMI